MPDLVLHHLEQSRSHRVLWLLEELGVDYALKRYARTAAGRAPKRRLREVHRLGKSPVIVHGARVIAESGAVIEYLLDELGDGRFRPPATSDEHLTYLQFMHFAEGTLMPPLLVKLITSRLRRAIPLVGKVIAGQVDKAFTDPEIRGNLDFVEAALEGRDWLTGELSGADFMMSFPLQAALSRSDSAPRPNLSKYLARIAARPAFRRALEKGGPVLMDV